MFEGFRHERVDTGEASIHLVRGGSGPPLLLLHGYPQNHIAWRKVAPLLAQQFTLVIPDLRGYGDSTGPPPDAAHANYSKRAMARDMVRVMEVLGFETFGLAGHDRGARVGYRLALDHPARVRGLAVLDIVPTIDVVDQLTCQTAVAAYHWLFLAQAHPLPETLIGGAPAFYLEHTLRAWGGLPEVIEPAAAAAYLRSFTRQEVIRAMCEDYRAGLSLDVEHDRRDRADSRRIACPVLVLWGTQGVDWLVSDPLAVWRNWAADVQGVPVPSGHFLMEQAPLIVGEALVAFFGRVALH